MQLAAAIALKNAVKRRWNKADADLQQKGKQPILVSDKQHIRQHLHAAVLRCAQQMHKSLIHHSVLPLVHICGFLTFTSIQAVGEFSACTDVCLEGAGSQILSESSCWK